MDLSRILVIEVLVFVRRQVNESEDRIVSLQVAALDVHLKAEDPVSALPVVTGVQSAYPAPLVMLPGLYEQRFRKPGTRCRVGFFEGRGLGIELCPDSTPLNTKIPPLKARGWRNRDRHDLLGRHRFRTGKSTCAERAQYCKG